MTINEEFYELAEAYLKGQLSEEETLRFEARIQAEPDLKEELQRIRLERSAIRATVKEDLQQLVLKELAAQPSVVPLWKRPVTAYAVAAVVVLLIATFLVIRQNPERQSQDLFAMNFEVPPMETVRGGEAAEEGKWLSVLNAYQQQDYEQAIEHLEVLLPDTTSRYAVEIRFYLGICYLTQDRSDDAIEALGLIPVPSLLYPDSRWYLALAYIKGDRIPEATIVLQKISEDKSSFYRERALKLLPQVMAK